MGKYLKPKKSERKKKKDQHHDIMTEKDFKWTQENLGQVLPNTKMALRIEIWDYSLKFKDNNIDLEKWCTS